MSLAALQRPLFSSSIRPHLFGSRFTTSRVCQQVRNLSLTPEGKNLTRWSWPWWKEWSIIMTVFAITGSSTVKIVRPVLKNGFGIEGSWKEGPWSYRGAYLATTLPLYSCVLVTVGTLFGRRPYFQRIALRMWGRFVPKKYRPLSH
ncbi:hypothetical protein K493DRAFT_311768 [Basidiobolus meristosporus CBS 931.73]|uniref:DUF6787 domain-containing protein n=1 Tax=Basidiobolus meristosporus CBS 931.73 TaxID=1314790 RepID=A0A1Y1YZ79_9FUNG|nr:hypothetical protein K493DRAFT_311768 [Basidiobolus meristosporus CBS 931.73]|eukprot:ORY03259.1 hypothetical protein K493DRAFT_311768 [Basidiobolus meristosporus CBS 931.73]